jgi:hypothetical protein
MRNENAVDIRRQGKLFALVKLSARDLGGYSPDRALARR